MRSVAAGWFFCRCAVVAVLLSSLPGGRCAVRAHEPGAAVVPDPGPADPVPSDPQLRWWKGNIHTHSLWSDGDQFPEMIAEWYRTQGYHFLALTDHNLLSEGQRWLPVKTVATRGGPEVLAQYRQRFGGGWVETRGEPDTDSHEVRLKPLDEFRALVEQRGQFLLIQAEEISDRVKGKPVHLNATNLRDPIQPVGGATVREAIANNLRAVEEQAERVGREILLHVNHPNFGLAVTAEDLAAVLAERFFEVYNGHPGVKHLGDADHPGVERLWDIANTIRVGKLNGPLLYGVATDDSHEYHGKPGSRPGRGWIQVRTRYLTPEHVVRAIKAGDFYASSGVALEDVSYDEKSKRLALKIQPQTGATYKTEFIGTLRGYDDTVSDRKNAQGELVEGATRKYSAQVGAVLSTVEGLTPSYQLTGDELFVRAVVTSTLPPVDAAFEGQRQQAWTQPVRIARP